MKSNTKYIFVTGGVVSGLGKGITAASLGRLLKNRGLKVSIQKFDPYLNVDPGTMLSLIHIQASIIIYIVQSGDTLWKIAKKYNTTVDKLMEINEIEIPELIKPGDKIIIEGRAVIVQMTILNSRFTIVNYGGNSCGIS